MLGGLFKRLTAIAVVAGCALVVVMAAGATLYFALRLVLVGWGAAAVTALVFAAIAAVTVTAFLGKAQGRDTADDDDDVHDEDDGGLAHRVVGVIKNRPIIGVVAALAGGLILLRNPALATIAATAFGAGSRKRRGHRWR